MTATPARSEATVGAPAPATVPPPPRGLVPALIFAAFGIYIASLTPVLMSLAVRVAAVSPGAKTTGLGVVIGVGGALSIITMPLSGALSDRTRTRWGKRRPWLVGGAVVSLLGLVVIGVAPSVAVITLGWCLAQVGFSATLAGFLALMPERLPENQRAKVSGLIGFMTAIAVMLGMMAASKLVAAPLLLMAGPGVITLVSVLVLSAVAARGEPADDSVPPPLRARDVLAMFYIDPRTAPDYGWTWLSRLLVGVSIAALTTYTAYFLMDHIGMDLGSATATASTATTITTPISLVCFLVAGVLSDRTGRRKPFVLLASVLVAVALVIATLTHTITMFYVVMVVLTLGQAFFLTVDIALAADVVPDPAQAAKAMSVYQVACNGPNVLVPLLAAPLLAIGGGDNYTALFIASAVLALVGGVIVLKVRSVR